jgi:hypothetical protein
LPAPAIDDADAHRRRKLGVDSASERREVWSADMTAYRTEYNMVLALQILLIAFCVQGLVKFAAGFLVPYPTRIRRIASYYARGGRIIGIYDTVTLLIITVLVLLLFLTQMHHLSFITGLIVGMLTIQIFFHRFNRVLPDERTPETPAPPNKLMSYAIQAQPALAWREIILMTALFVWALAMLLTHLQLP